MKFAALVLAPMLAGCATVPASAPLELAITVDDLPLHGPIPKDETPQSVAERLIAGLKAGGAREAIGFVNGHWLGDEPATRDVLASWRRAGLSLGNHGWNHRNLDDLSDEQFEEELTRNEAILKPLGKGTDWHWFRYPFLAEGNSPAKLATGRAILQRHGYKVAAVTMDFSDWQFTAPYARCVDKGDVAGIARLEQLYLAAAQKSIGRTRQLAREIYGRDIPYVLLIHEGAFTARMAPQLLALYRSAGFRFVSLATAERDPAYASDVAADRSGPAATLEGRAADRGTPLPPPPLDAKAVTTVCA